MKKILFVILLLLLNLNIYAQGPFTKGFNIINDIQNNAKSRNITFNANQFIGKPTIVIKVGTYCPYSHNELELLRKIYNQYYGLFNVIVAVVDPENIDKLRVQYGDQFTYIPGYMLTSYNSGVPFTIYVDDQGEIIDTDEGWSPSLEQVITKFIETYSDM